MLMCVIAGNLHMHTLSCQEADHCTMLCSAWKETDRKKELKEFILRSPAKPIQQTTVVPGALNMQTKPKQTHQLTPGAEP